MGPGEGACALLTAPDLHSTPVPRPVTENNTDQMLVY